MERLRANISATALANARPRRSVWSMPRWIARRSRFGSSEVEGEIAITAPSDVLAEARLVWREDMHALSAFVAPRTAASPAAHDPPFCPENRRRLLFNDVVLYLRASGYGGGYLFIDDIENLVDQMARKARIEFAKEFALCTIRPGYARTQSTASFPVSLPRTNKPPS